MSRKPWFIIILTVIVFLAIKPYLFVQKESNKLQTHPPFPVTYFSQGEKAQYTAWWWATPEEAAEYCQSPKDPAATETFVVTIMGYYDCKGGYFPTHRAFMNPLPEHFLAENQGDYASCAGRAGWLVFDGANLLLCYNEQEHALMPVPSEHLPR